MTDGSLPHDIDQNAQSERQTDISARARSLGARPHRYLHRQGIRVEIFDGHPLGAQGGAELAPISDLDGLAAGAANSELPIEEDTPRQLKGRLSRRLDPGVARQR